MSDKYLFRGKRTANGEWVIGCLSKRLHSRSGDIVPCIDFEDAGNVCSYYIDPNTVGQSIGIRATMVDGEYKDGGLIYEGDWISVFAYDYTGPNSGITGIVGFDGGILGIQDIETGKISCLCELQRGYITHYQIHGNVHDSQELREKICRNTDFDEELPF